MAINLPETPACRSATPEVQEFGGAMTGPLGGQTRLVRRLGDRMSVFYDYGPMDAACADAFIAARMRARAEGQTMVGLFPNQRFTAAIGSPKIDGADQLGTLINMKGFTAGTKVTKGWVFSFTAGSRLYTHLVTGAVVADGDGKAAVHVAPMFRASPADNASLNFTAPQIEGFVVERTKWTIEMLRWKGVSFTLAENA